MITIRNLALSAILGACMMAPASAENCYPWTPHDISGANLSITVNSAKYCVSGALIYVQADVTYPLNTSTVTAALNAPVYGNGTSQALTIGYNDGMANIGASLINANPQPIVFYRLNTINQANNNQLSGGRIVFTGTYDANPALITWADGQQVPAAFLNQVFNASGPLFQVLPAAPQIASGSSTIMSYYFGTTPQFNVGFIDNAANQAQFDFSFPIYQAASTDPLIRIFCTQSNSVTCEDNGISINIPSLAAQAGGGDHHMSVIEPNGVEYDFWEVSTNPPYSAGQTIQAIGETHFNLDGTTVSNFVAPGFNAGAATAGGEALSTGQVYTSELAAGVINHAIFLTFPCGTNTFVFPASQISGTCAGGSGMPLGSRVWWSLSDTATNALSAPADLKTVLRALHKYGGYYMDSTGAVGSGMSAHMENQEAYWIYGGGVDPALNYVSTAPGWNHIINGNVNRWLLAVAGNIVNFSSNLQVIAPCVTQQTC
jgi:hypothetical protein